MSPPLRNAIYINWQDVDGRQSDGYWPLLVQSPLTPSPYDLMMSSAQALTVAGQVGIVQQIAIPGKTVAVNGPFGTVFDQLVIVTRSVLGYGAIALPAPQQSLFLQDTVTLNMRDPRIQLFITYASQVIGDSFGNPILLWGPGYRRMIRAAPGT